MELDQAFRWIIGAIVAVVGLGTIVGLWWTGVGPIVGLVLLAAGLLLMGYPRLANWLRDLFDR